MSANTPRSTPGPKDLHSKPGGGLVWTAGFLLLLFAALLFLGQSPGAQVSLNEALGPDVETTSL